MTLLVLIVLAVAGAYGFSLWRHPYRPCPRCRGRKSHFATAFTGAYGRCWRCKGKGEFPRLGVRLLMPRTVKAIQDGRKGRNY